VSVLRHGPVLEYFFHRRTLYATPHPFNSLSKRPTYKRLRTRKEKWTPHTVRSLLSVHRSATTRVISRGRAFASFRFRRTFGFHRCKPDKFDQLREHAVYTHTSTARVWIDSPCVVFVKRAPYIYVPLVHYYTLPVVFPPSAIAPFYPKGNASILSGKFFRNSSERQVSTSLAAFFVHLWPSINDFTDLIAFFSLNRQPCPGRLLYRIQAYKKRFC